MDNSEIEQLLSELQKEKHNLHENDVIINQKLNDISIMCFIQNVESMVHKLFYVSVKICDNLNEFDSLDISYNKTINPNCYYYVVQIFISKLFQTKLIDNTWIARINISNLDTNVCRIVNLKNLVASDVLTLVIPFVKSEKESVIETRFYLPNQLNYWPNFSVSRINTDISYFLTPLYEHKIVKPDNNPLFEISTVYTDSIRLRISKPVFEYRFNCKINIKHIFEVVLKNCFHKLHLNHIQLLNSNDDVCDIQLFVCNSNSNASIIFDKKNKILKLKGNIEVLNKIKEFLISNVQKETQILIESSLFVRLQNLRKQLSIESSENIIHFENIKMLYEEYKNIVAELPV